MGVIVEEPKKLITTLSRDDSAILAEIMEAIKGMYTSIPVHNCVMSF